MATATITDGNVGRAFLTNGIASVVLAALLLVRRELLIRIAALLLAAGTLVSFVMSRTLDDGFFGFTEKGLEPSPQAAIALVAEILAIIVLAASLVPALRWRQQAVVNPVVGWGLALVFVAVGVIARRVWANTGSVDHLRVGLGRHDAVTSRSTTAAPPTHRRRDHRRLRLRPGRTRRRRRRHGHVDEPGRHDAHGDVGRRHVHRIGRTSARATTFSHTFDAGRHVRLRLRHPLGR